MFGFSAPGSPVIGRVAKPSARPVLQSATVSISGAQVQLAFSAPVRIGAGGNGGFSVTLNGGPATLTYASGSGTPVLLYNVSRTVVMGETGTLDYAQPGNGVVSDAGLVELASASIGVTNNSAQVPPTVTSRTINAGGTTLSIGFAEAVSFGAGGNGGFALTMSGGAVTLTYASGAGSFTLVYNLSRTVDLGETGTLDYTQPGNGVESQATGLDLVSVSGLSVTNNSTQRPTLTSATIPSAGTTITLAFSKTVQVGVGGAGGFTLSLTGGAVTATYASGSGGSSLVYNLSRTVNSGETGTISYTQPGNGIEATASGADVATFTNSAVTNNSSTGSTAPVTLAFDTATPHQVSIVASHSRTLAEGSTAQVYYRVTGGGSWIDGGYLYRTRTAYGAGSNSFAGWVVDLQPGTTYDVRLDVTEPGVGSWQITGTRATRALPAEGAAQTKSATTANFASVMAGAVAGDVIVLAAGTYTLSGFAWTSPGTSGSPVVIRGSGIGSTILVDSTGYVLTLTGSYYTFEDLTIRGSQTDSGTAASSLGVRVSNGSTNVTLRRVRIEGCDKGISAEDIYTQGLLVYDCQFAGNNTWAMTEGPPQNQTWNDTGIQMPGFGNCVWNCTFSGHGDTVKLGHNGAWGASRACYMSRCWVKYAGDDGLIEFDEADGNCAAYDNRLGGSATGASFDGIGSGPVGVFRNVLVNQTRMALKFTSTARGVRIYSNTWVATARAATWDYGFYAASNTIYDFDYRNNVLAYRGAGALVSFNTVLVGSTLTDYNAWYPDGRSIYFGSGSGTWTGLTSAKANLAPRMAHDVIVASDPFVAPITLGADYSTQYTGHLDARIASGAAKNAGVAIAGVTDGYSGAAPDIGADIAGRVLPAIGAASDPMIPEWARTQTAQTWSVVPAANTLNAIRPSNNPALNPAYPGAPEWNGDGDQSNIVAAWCGASYDDATDTMWIGVSGGHRDYGGNEVYRCRFSTPTPVWEMVRPPSGAIGNLLTTNDGQEASGVYSDGRPRSVHTYNKWAYVPGVGPVLGIHGNTYYSSTAGRSWSVFIDATTGEAQFSAQHPPASSTGTGSATTYDPSRHALWIASANNSTGIYRYNIPTSGGAHTGAAASLVASTPSRELSSLCYLPSHDCLLVAYSSEVGGSSGWRVLDCATGTVYAPAFNGTAALGNLYAQTQWRWVPSLGAACGWHNSGNTTLITRLTPGANPRTDAWTIDTLPVSGANAVTPSNRASQGTYGRFAYSPRLGGFLVFNSTSGSTYFYKI